MLVRHVVQDYNRWRAAFDDALVMRRSSGEQSYRIFRNFENANEVTVICDYDTLERAQKFIKSEELKKAMAAAGVTEPPKVSYLHEAVNIRLSSAD